MRYKKINIGPAHPQFRTDMGISASNNTQVLVLEYDEPIAQFFGITAKIDAEIFMQAARGLNFPQINW